jgi:hypothetical protein
MLPPLRYGDRSPKKDWALSGRSVKLLVESSRKGQGHYFAFLISFFQYRENSFNPWSGGGCFFLAYAALLLSWSQRSRNSCSPISTAI